MADEDRERSVAAYGELLEDPLGVLRRVNLSVNMLPAVPDATVTGVFFAAGDSGMAIDQSAATAAAYARADIDGAVQYQMLVSNMRAYGLPVGSGTGNRHAPTRTTGAGADLWVTEMQTGCTVLIVDWGRGQYSMIHLQPSDDTQFNRFGRKLIGLSDFTRSGYKNTWLKQEITTIVQNTGRTPQYYIMVQSMFDASRKLAVHVFGVRVNGKFQFYRQRARGRHIDVQQLAWSGWYSYLPYLSY